MVALLTLSDEVRWANGSPESEVLPASMRRKRVRRSGGMRGKGSPGPKPAPECGTIPTLAQT
jgi:hypothetical protein